MQRVSAWWNGLDTPSKVAVVGGSVFAVWWLTRPTKKSGGGSGGWGGAGALEGAGPAYAPFDSAPTNTPPEDNTTPDDEPPDDDPITGTDQLGFTGDMGAAYVEVADELFDAGAEFETVEDATDAVTDTYLSAYLNASAINDLGPDDLESENPLLDNAVEDQIALQETPEPDLSILVDLLDQGADEPEPEPEPEISKEPAPEPEQEEKDNALDRVTQLVRGGRRGGRRGTGTQRNNDLDSVK